MLCIILPCVLHFLGPLHSMVKGIGKEKDGLYILQPAKKPSLVKTPEQSSAITFNTTITTTNSCPTSTPASTSPSSKHSDHCSIWHQWLGHAPVEILHKIHFLKHHDLNKELLSYTICPLARQTRLPFPTIHNKTVTLFELVHKDVWCPYRQCTYNGYKYFLTIVDNYSRMTWIYLMRMKSDVFLLIKSFLILVKNWFDANIKIIRSDNGLEFFNSQCSTLFTSVGILHQNFCVQTPQQNKVAERK